MVQVVQEAVGVALLIGGFQQMFGGAFKMERGILDMKDFMKEMVNTLSPLMGLYSDLVPAFLWRWNSRED